MLARNITRICSGDLVADETLKIVATGMSLIGPPSNIVCLSHLQHDLILYRALPDSSLPISWWDSYYSADFPSQHLQSAALVRAQLQAADWDEHFVTHSFP